MHGLIFRTIEAFVTESFGADAWTRALNQADVEIASFEAMFHYEDAYLPKVLRGCSEALDRPTSTILEDIGLYLITRQNHASIRRLLRFGGQTFPELLRSLDDLPGRTRLAIPGLDLPRVSVTERKPHEFLIRCEGGPDGFAHVLVGLLRAMADDYGTLATLDHHGTQYGADVIEATVFDTCFAEDRGFSLADMPLQRSL
ncbi:heme NO-binding domain-containing protein [Marivita sp. S2033]